MSAIDSYHDKARLAAQQFEQELFSVCPLLLRALPAEYQQLEQQPRTIHSPAFEKDVSEASVIGFDRVFFSVVDELKRELHDQSLFDGLCRFVVESHGVEWEIRAYTLHFYLWVKGRYVQLEQPKDSLSWSVIKPGQQFVTQMEPLRILRKVDDQTAVDAQGLEVFCEPAEHGYFLVESESKQRELTTHRVNGVNDQLRIRVLDGPGAGGACHEYEIVPVGEAMKNCRPCFISFQNGPIKEAGVNGVTHEALLAILIDRLEGFQSGQYACHDNQMALDHLQSARLWLTKRTLDRISRNVEGTLRA